MATSQDFVTWSCSDALDPDYLMNALIAEGDDIRAFGKGTTHTTIYFPEVKAFHLALPPLAEQRRIVAKLDALSARSKRARAELERVEALAARAKQAVLNRFVLPGDDRGWPLVQIGDVAVVVTGGTPPAAEKEKSFGDRLPFIKPSDLDSGYDVSIPREYLSEFGMARARVVPAMSVLVTCIGATIGKTGLARVRCSTNQQINALVGGPSINSKWLYWRVIANDFQEQIRKNSSATTLPIINKSRFQSLSLALPPLDVQSRAVGEIEAAMRGIDLGVTEARQAHHLLGRLDQSILSRAFRGELVPQDPSDEPASVLLDRIRAAAGSAPKRRRRGG